jgi:dihydrofolate reductase
LALPHVDVLYLTEVDLEPPGDAWFPEFDKQEWRMETEAEAVDPFPYAYRTYYRLTRRIGIPDE